MMELPAAGGMPPRPGGAAPPVVTPPTGPSPAMAGPQEGLKAQARIKMSQGAKLLIDALGGLKEVGSDEAKAIISCLKTLAPVLPEVGEGLGQSEIASMLSGAQAVRPAQQGGMLGIRPPMPRMIGGPPMGGMR